jgi:hypothetical protein
MSKKRSLHVMVDADIYEKLRHICFYEHMSMAGILRGLLVDFLDKKALEETEVNLPLQL